MYRFIQRKCQEKNEAVVEKESTIFSNAELSRARIDSDHVLRAEQSDHQAGNQIMPCGDKAPAD
jgi:hypothetical protein